MFPLLRRASVDVAEAILEYVLPAHVYGQILPPDSLVDPLQFLPEVTPLHVKVKDPCVIHEHGERSVGQRRVGLSQDLVQHGAVGLWNRGAQSMICYMNDSMLF